MGPAHERALELSFRSKEEKEVRVYPREQYACEGHVSTNKQGRGRGVHNANMGYTFTLSSGNWSGLRMGLKDVFA
ncbi:hypothetical protein TNCT_75991 [Trichonephila clavata]|uniref:Uncharacterized protein n=1 Tax=Trichonephila clavata TaxID=2740835 RepID=A0A8X6LEB8_TRICU|nr:hypothetical protein TNCT_75991 [Trichonephila clavata]